MQDLAILIGDLALNTSDFQKAVGVQMQKVVDDVHFLTGEMNSVKEDINFLKNDVHLTHAQKLSIKQAVSDRVYYLLGIPRNKADRTKEQEVIAYKYGKLFHSRCRRDVTKLGHLMIPEDMTPNKFFDEAIKDIEAWVPAGGVSRLKEEADSNAIARMVAKNQGY